MHHLALKFPPTINSYYCHTRNGVYISKKGKDYRLAIASAVREQFSSPLPISSTINCTVLVSMPDKRIRDLDNYMKALLDACTHAGVWEDDSLIDQLLIYRAAISKGGGVIMLLDEAGPVMPMVSLLELFSAGSL